MGHGTRSPAGQQEFLELVDMARARFDGPVAAGFIELAEPTLATALKEITALPIARLVIAPVILLPAGHLKDDGAELARAARRARPDLDVVLASDLGTSLELIECLDRRITEVARPDSALLVVGRGATDPAANAELCKIARLVAEGRGLPLTDTAFVSLAPPDVPAGLARLVQLGASSVVVSPYFLFQGDLLARIASQARAFASDVGIAVEVARHLGPDRLVLDALWRRIAEAEGHEVRTNCDTCHWRRPTADDHATTSLKPAHASVSVTTLGNNRSTR